MIAEGRAAQPVDVIPGDRRQTLRAPVAEAQHEMIAVEARVGRRRGRGGRPIDGGDRGEIGADQEAVPRFEPGKARLARAPEALAEIAAILGIEVDGDLSAVAKPEDRPRDVRRHRRPVARLKQG